MIIQRAYKTELDPTAEQKDLLSRHFDVARFAYNWALGRGNGMYMQTGKRPSINDLKKQFNALKADWFPWVSEVSTYAMQSAFADVKKALANYFREMEKFKRKERKDEPGFPKFKKKGKAKRACRLYGCIHVTDRQIQIPRIGGVRLKESSYLPSSGAKILNVSLSERAGKWFVSLQVEEEISDPAPRQESIVGVDLGIKTLATCSDGKTFDNPKALRHQERRIARLNRECDRRKKGSSNREKTNRKLSRVHYRIACIRSAAMHEATTSIARAHTTIVLEDLNIRGMLKNHHLAGAVSDAGMYEFGRAQTYKAEWRGGRVIRADRWSPSSKTCSACGVVKEVLKLSERVFRCDSCGFSADRDLNAAFNLRKLAGTMPDSINACGGGLAPDESGTLACG